MLFRVFERLFVIGLLLSSMQVVNALISGPAVQDDRMVVSADLHMPSIAVGAALSLWGGLLVLMRWRQVLNATRAVWPLLGLAALALLSIAWSVDPVLTLRRSALVLVSTVFAIYLGERYTMEKWARLLAETLCLMMMMVIVARFVAPAYVIDRWGAWRGLSAYKNSFGECMAVAIVLLLLIRFRHFRWLRYVFLVTAAVLLVFSHSVGALLSCVLVVYAMWLWRLTRFNSERRLLVCAITALVISLGTVLIMGILGNSDLFFQILQRDPTLTGRTHLWSMVLSAISKHPILGYGYGAFWSGLQPEATTVWIGTRWAAPRADNGYLEQCLGLGLVGVCVSAWVLVHSFRRAMDYIRWEPGRIGLWPIAYLCFFVLHNVCESELLTPGTFPFLVFAMIITSLEVNWRRAVTLTYDTERPSIMSDRMVHPLTS